MERVKGIEPSYAAWEAAVLPLNYTRDRPPDSMGPVFSPSPSLKLGAFVVQNDPLDRFAGCADHSEPIELHPRSPA